MLEFFGQRDENFGSGRPDRPTPAALSAAKNLELGRRDAVLFPCRAATTLSVHNLGGCLDLAKLSTALNVCASQMGGGFMSR